MHLLSGLHLGYCTNIHRGETWEEIFAALQTHTLAVRDRVAPNQRYGIGLRLGARAASELADPSTQVEFQRWLEKNECYVFTINGFPYGQFHGTRVKEQVYLPDWSTVERLDYTKRLFDLLGELVPPGGGGSVSTLPLSFKEFAVTPEQFEAMRANIEGCARHIEKVAASSGRELHLGLEPEPLCTLETSDELIDFLSGFDEDVMRVVGMNYDTCHLAVEFEEPREALSKLRAAGVRISKFHLSSALKLRPSSEALNRLGAFSEDTYLHQVISRGADGELRRFTDLPQALAAVEFEPPAEGDEWRVHFHVPVHAQPELVFNDTRDHIEAILDFVAEDPALCTHFEIETYTWDVLPAELRQPNVVDQITKEYQWVLGEMKKRSLG
ncbi:MAG: metabolite traffic protein EboE [Verrucomicrobiales bacterium]